MAKKQPQDQWQSKLYDDFFASRTLGTADMKKIAKQEIKTLIAKLKLGPSVKVLDISCGTGRHLYQLGKRKISGVGIDLSEACLKQAKAQTKGLPLKFLLGNMNNLKRFYKQFDVTLCLFSSFGYFYSDEENRKVLVESYQSLRDDGVFVLQITDKENALDQWSNGDWVENRNKLIIEARRYDEEKSQLESQMVIVDKKTSKARLYFARMRLYSVSEMTDLLYAVGFKKVEILEDLLSEKAATKQATHPVYFAYK
jgi:SAM-dependent methyltransferase